MQRRSVRWPSRRRSASTRSRSTADSVSTVSLLAWAASTPLDVSVDSVVPHSSVAASAARRSSEHAAGGLWYAVDFDVSVRQSPCLFLAGGLTSRGWGLVAPIIDIQASTGLFPV